MTAGEEMAPNTDFQEIPTLRLSEARNPATKQAFLKELRGALLTVGFLYLADTGIPDAFIQEVIEQCHAFFQDLPEEEKLKIEMKNEKSFLGYNKVGMEMTAGAEDWREQYDLSTPHPIPGPDAPLYHNLLAPNQWPSDKYLPKFRAVYEEYMRQMTAVSELFTTLIAEALGLDSTAFDRFFDKHQQHKLKLIKYPDNGEGVGQGVGPQKDSMLSSYLLQASEHKGLQAQNSSGEWIDVPPKQGTLVVAIGQGMEALTQAVCTSTTHRVLSPAAGTGPRFSIPFFQGISYDAIFEYMEVPEHVLNLRKEIVNNGGNRTDNVEFTFVKGKWNRLGEATLMNRVKSHPDVGEKWYPDLLAQIRREQAV